MLSIQLLLSRTGCRLHRLKLVSLLLALSGLMAGCESMQYPLDTFLGPPAEQPVSWKPLFRGVDIVRYSEWNPPLNLWCVRVDLAAPGVSPVVTSQNGDRPLDTDGATTLQFLQSTHVQLAVNASPFYPVNGIEGSPRKIVGISESNGDRYSPPQGTDGALLFDAHGRAWVVGQQQIGHPGVPGDIMNAVGGFSVILSNGRNLGSTDQRDPRTAAGVSADHRYLYLLIVDGRQLAWSVGVTTRELASWLRFFGASSGLALDGGGSTTLAVGGPQGQAYVVNSPIDGLSPGKLRIVGNNLGIRALPLGAPRDLRRTLAGVAAAPQNLR